MHIMENKTQFGTFISYGFKQ